MLARLHFVFFFFLCLLSSVCGGFIAVALLRLISDRANSFSDLILTLTLVPISVICPPLVLYGLRKEEKRSLEEARLYESRTEKQFLSSEQTFESDGSIRPKIAEPDYYSLLGVEPTTSQAELKRRYDSIVGEVHSDGYPRASSLQELEAMEEAYAILSDPSERIKYDLSRLLELQSSQPATVSENRTPSYPLVRQPVPVSAAGATSLSLLSVSLVGLVVFLAGAALTFVSLELIYAHR